MHRQVRHAHGVIGIVQFGGRYPTVDEEALVQLRDRIGAAEVKELNYELSQGDQVKILEGAFVGLEAGVTQVLPAKERVKVLVDFFGGRVQVEVEHASVLLQVAHPLAA